VPKRVLRLVRCLCPWNWPFAVRIPYATGLSISKHGEVTGISISFPRIVDGKPLITRRDEKVEFRLILNQHVFETTFHLNPSDLFNGTETVLRTPHGGLVPVSR
jgi:hypothetical protein